MVATTTLVCSSCWNPIGSRAEPIRLFDLAFHELCAPRCRACGSRLTTGAEERWSYDGKVVSSTIGYSLHPTEFWCDGCRELHERDNAFAQD
jgi:hypothetical protein